MRRPIQLTIFLLIALLAGGALVMGIRNVHTAAARTACGNKLHALAMGAHNYASSFQRFPSGTVVNPALAPEKRLSWLTEIWPYYMVGGIMTRFEADQAWDAPANNPPHFLRRVYPAGGGEHRLVDFHMDVLEEFVCSANPDRIRPDLPSVTHYVGIAGVGDDAAELPLSDPRAGFFGYDRRLSPNDIQNGLAATLMLGEVTDAGPWTAGGKATVQGLSPSQAYLGEAGRFTSRHEPANFAFADASVRPLSNSTPPRVFEAMARIARSE